MIEARLSLLSHDLACVLEAAAVVGTTFWQGVLFELLPEVSREEIERALTDLVRREWIVEHASSKYHSELELAFRHGAILDAAEAGISAPTRAAAQGVVANWLEQCGEPDASVVAMPLFSGFLISARRHAGWPRAGTVPGTVQGRPGLRPKRPREGTQSLGMAVAQRPRRMQPNPRATASSTRKRATAERARGETRLPNPRGVGDPSADRLVAALDRRGLLAEVDVLLARVARNDDPIPAQMPPSVRRFLEREAVPSWAEPARIRRAQAFADRHAVAITCALFCASLPAAFAGAKGAAVLAITRRLHEDVDRRVNETGRYVFDVLAPGGLDAGGRGVRSTQKVRLVHAAVRQMAARAGKTESSEVPINQEDLLGTLLCFSVVVLDAITRLGVRVTDGEAEDFLHLWCVVGSIAGIHREMLPRDLSEARLQAGRIRGQQMAVSSHGRELARVLIDGMERHLPIRGLGIVAPAIVRHLLGDEIGDVLGLPSGLRRTDVQALLARVAWRPSRGGDLGRAIPGLGRRAIDALLAVKLGQRPPSFGTPLAAATPTCPWRAPGTSAPARDGSMNERVMP